MALTVRITSEDGTVQELELESGAEIQISAGDSIEIVDSQGRPIEIAVDDFNENNVIVTILAPQGQQQVIIDGIVYGGAAGEDETFIFTDLALYIEDEDIASSISYIDPDTEELTVIADIEELLAGISTAAGGAEVGAGFTPGIAPDPNDPNLTDPLGIPPQDPPFEIAGPIDLTQGDVAEEDAAAAAPPVGATVTFTTSGADGEGAITGEDALEGGFIAVTATVNLVPVGSDLVLTLSPSGTLGDSGDDFIVTILVGETSGVAFVEAQGDDVYIDPSTETFSVIGASGGGYDELLASVPGGTTDEAGNPTVSVDVLDTIDTTTVTLGDVNVSEGDPSFTYGATVNNAVDPTGSDLVVTLSNGVEITIAAGATSGTSATQAIQGDDVHLDSASFDVSISGTSGGNYEDLNTADTATVTISDTIDTTTVTLGDVNVSEGDPSFTYGATVNNAVDPTGSDLVVTLSNGVEITIAAGATSGTSATQAIQGDDVHLDSASFDVSISGTSGGNYEDLNTADTATVTISDTIDTTTVTLGDVNVSEGDPSFTYGATVNNAVDPTGSDLVVTLSNGVEITIAAGATSGTSATQAIQGDDVHLDSASFDVSISGTSGGNYEDLNTADTATVTISDTIDTTTVTLGDVNVSEGDPSFTYGATVNNAVDPTGSDLVVTLSNGVEITIAAGATSGTSATQAIQGDDVHLDSASFDVSISTSGGNYEDLNTADTATVTISDTIDTTTVTLGDVNVSEGDPSFTYGATVNNAVDPTGSAGGDALQRRRDHHRGGRDVGHVGDPGDPGR